MGFDVYPPPIPGAAAVQPWMVDIDVFLSAAENTNWPTNEPWGIVDTAHLYNGYRASAGNINDKIGWDVVLSAGTWTLDIMVNTQSNQGIVTASLDGVTLGTMDCYTGSSLKNQRRSVTGFTVGYTGKYRLLLTMASKNASSSAYQCVLNHVHLRRTA